ncbi:MAG: hypothetical protein R3B90_04645 [Planctomycetaceae bacterium]
MSGHHIYRQRRASGWARIDMLLAIYDATLAKLREGLRIARAQGDVPPAMRLESHKLLLTLLEGVNVESGDAARNIERLLTWCLSLVATSDAAAWQAAHDVVETLHAAFVEIEDEARQLERLGVIPPLDWQTTAGEARV